MATRNRSKSRIVNARGADLESRPAAKPKDKVGYQKPARATRFKQGQSGNPRGRPKGKRRKGHRVADAQRADLESRPAAKPKDTVGFRKPPRATRFKRGQSGNPRGRLKGKQRDGHHVVDARRAGLASRPTAKPKDIVGYRKPPRATRFKSGQSGNPRGRPKGKRRQDIGSDLSEEMFEKITLREGERVRRVTKQRALLKTLSAKALKGDARATAELIKLITRTNADATDVVADIYDETDLAVLEEFARPAIENLKRRLKRS